MKFYQMSIEDVIAKFNSNVESGLSIEEAKRRLREYGQNILLKKEAVSWYTVLLRQFLSPLMFVLLFAAIASILIGEINDSIVIGMAVFINVILGFIQEWKAEKAAKALSSYEVLECNVKRDGNVFSIKTSELVPGDIVLISEGLRIPADMRLIKVVDLEIDETLLTGESDPVKKTFERIEDDMPIGERLNMVYRGTIVLHGRGEGVVVATGMKTVLGDIASLTALVESEPTPIQVQLKKFSWFLGSLMLFSAVAIFL